MLLVFGYMCDSFQILTFLLHCFVLFLAWNLNELSKIIFAVNMGSLINCARERGQWDFLCRPKQLVLISCLEDSTNEVELP